MGKQFSIAVLCLVVSTHSLAQGSIKGRLYDSAAKQPLSLATVTVFKAIDTSIITYRLSDPAGNFRVPSLPQGINLRAVITSSGYKVFRREFMLENGQQLDLGTINLATDTTELDEALVIAERPPVSVKKDTIEFNASAFKTLPTALVEDLLKKLPGVEVDQEGNIRVNGRTVNRILVDGKDFFGGDPKVATRNLPANLIEKVQVVDDKEQLDRNPEINKADLGQVINLKFKKSIKKGWFGKAYAGGGDGAEGHYEAGAIINSFRDTAQISALAYTNNLNKAGFGFADLENLGGFKRSGTNSVSIWSDGGIALNGISFGATNQGIQRSTGAGLNFNHDPGNKLKINFQYFFGHINNDFQSVSNLAQTFNDTVLATRSKTVENGDDYNHRFGLRFTWKIDTLSSTINFRPSINLRSQKSTRNYFSESYSNYEPKLNETDNDQLMENKEFSYAHELSLNKNFRKRGRTLFLNTTLDFRATDNEQGNLVKSIFYDGQQSQSNLDQLRDRNWDNLGITASGTYTDPITKQLSWRLTHAMNYFKDDDQYATFNRDSITGEYTVINPALTNGLDRTGMRNTTGISFVQKWKKWTITPGVQVMSLAIDNDYTKNGSINQHFFNVFPTLNINWGSLNAGYRAFLREPSANDLRPVIDNTNPLYQNLGNPDLQPSITHNFNLGWYKYDAKKLLNFNVYLNLTSENDAVVRERYVDPKGVQVTRPVNVDGVWRSNMSVFVSKQWKLINSWQISLRPGFSSGIGKNFVIVNSNRSAIENYEVFPNLNLAFNWKDLFEISQRYSLSYRENKYENPTFRNTSVTAHFATSELIVRLPKNWVWETQLDYRYNPQVSPGISKTILKWHAGINYLFLKDQKGQLKLYVFDILNQNTIAYRVAAENYVQDVETKALTRYVMLTFTYNIRDFKGGKVGGRQSMFFF